MRGNIASSTIKGKTGNTNASPLGEIAGYRTITTKLSLICGFGNNGTIGGHKGFGKNIQSIGFSLSESFGNECRF